MLFIKIKMVLSHRQYLIIKMNKTYLKSDISWVFFKLLSMKMIFIKWRLSELIVTVFFMVIFMLMLWYMYIVNLINTSFHKCMYTRSFMSEYVCEGKEINSYPDCYHVDNALVDRIFRWFPKITLKRKKTTKNVQNFADL